MGWVLISIKADRISGSLKHATLIAHNAFVTVKQRARIVKIFRNWIARLSSVCVEGNPQFYTKIQVTLDEKTASGAGLLHRKSITFKRPNNLLYSC